MIRHFKADWNNVNYNLPGFKELFLVQNGLTECYPN